MVRPRYDLARYSFSRSLLWDCLRSVGDRGLVPLIHVQLEDIRPRVVTDNIQVEFAADDLRRINFSGQYRLPLPIRSGKRISEGVHDAAAARACR